MSNEKEITRRFSKKITLNSLIAFFGIAFIGIIFRNPDTAGILEALGPWVVAMLAIYMSVGYLDFRTAQGLPSFFDTLLTLVFSRKQPRKRSSNEEGEAE